MNATIYFTVGFIFGFMTMCMISPLIAQVLEDNKDEINRILDEEDEKR